MDNDRFVLTDQHVKLLRRSYWRLEGGDLPGGFDGVASMNPKRPYGNSNVYDDIAELLGMDPEGGDGEFTDAQYAEMLKIHHALPTALEVICHTGSFEPGVYESPRYGRKWRKVEA